MRNQFPNSLLCKIAGIDRSNFYKWLKKYIPGKYEKLDNTLKEVFAFSEKTYGYRRMHLAVRSLGFKENEKKIRKKVDTIKYSSNVNTFSVCVRNHLSVSFRYYRFV